MGASTETNPCSSKKALAAWVITERIFKRAVCREDLSHKWRLSMRNATPWSFFEMGTPRPLKQV